MSESETPEGQEAPGQEPRATRPETERLLEWIKKDNGGPAPPAGTLPHVTKEPYDRARHIDETGRWLAKMMMWIFGLALFASWAAIVMRLGDASALDGWMRLIIPSLTSLVGAAFGFYLRSRIGAGD